jgi:hypothetical protein
MSEDMSLTDGQSFDEPDMKAALRRNFCNEKAPAHLRERIGRSLSAESSTEAFAESSAETQAERTAPGAMRLNPTSADPVGLPTLFPGFAIAASMMLVIGGVALVLSNSTQPIPRGFEAAAIARHDGCCQAPDHHMPGVPKADFTMIGAYLRQQLNHPVLAADLAADHWTFSGAAICPVCGVPSAHLLFRNGQDSLSVFSLPASAIPSLADNQTYEGTTDDGHTIVARSLDGAIYCIVSRAPAGQITSDSLDQLLHQHQGEATVAEVPGPPIILAGIPREP